MRRRDIRTGSRLRAAWANPWLPGVVLGLVYAWRCWRIVAAAGTQPYWTTWGDQSLYQRSAEALARFDLRSGEHWYPLLYPLLGAPFAGAPPGTTFLLPDLLCFLVAFEGFRRVAAVLGVPGWPAAALFWFATLRTAMLARLWVEPWTSTPSAALLWLALGLGAGLLAGRGGGRAALLLGAALAAIPFSRLSDAPLTTLIGAGVATWLLCRGERRAVTLLIGGGIAVLLPLAALYVAIHGPHPSDYMRLSAAYGANLAWIGWKADILLADPRPWFGAGDGTRDGALKGVLERLPWLALGAAGLLHACVARRGAERRAALLVAGTAAVFLLLVLSYVDLLPTGLWRYNLIHYLKWLFPLFAMFAACWLVAAARRPVALLAAVPVMLLACLHTVPVPAGGAGPARLLLFADPQAGGWAQVYAAESAIREHGGVQRNGVDYRQFQTGSGELRAVALKRPFAGDERWHGDARAAPSWRQPVPRTYGEARLPDRRLRAVARFGLGVRFGWPCWLPPGSCGEPIRAW